MSASPGSLETFLLLPSALFCGREVHRPGDCHYLQTDSLSPQLALKYCVCSPAVWPGAMAADLRLFFLPWLLLPLFGKRSCLSSLEKSAFISSNVSSLSPSISSLLERLSDLHRAFSGGLPTADVLPVLHLVLRRPLTTISSLLPFSRSWPFLSNCFARLLSF